MLELYRFRDGETFESLKQELSFTFEEVNKLCEEIRDLLDRKKEEVNEETAIDFFKTLESVKVLGELLNGLNRYDNALTIQKSLNSCLACLRISRINISNSTPTPAQIWNNDNWD